MAASVPGAAGAAGVGFGMGTGRGAGGIPATGGDPTLRTTGAGGVPRTGGAAGDVLAAGL